MQGDLTALTFLTDLGKKELSFSLNFSRPAAPIIAQYFNFINLGFEGYRNIALNDMRNARLLSRALDASSYYTVLSEIHKGPDGKAVDSDDVEDYAAGLPVVAYRFSDAFKAEHPDIPQSIIQTLLRVKGWVRIWLLLRLTALIHV